MLHIRVVTAVALVLVMAGAAAAQSDDVSGTAPPGKPVSLLQILLKPASSEPANDETAATAAQTINEQAQPEPKAHTRVAHRHKSARKYARRKAHDDDATAQSPASDSAAAAPSPDTAANVQAAPDQSNMSAVVVDGHTVQIAAPDQVNMMDMAAGDTSAAPQQTMAAPQPAAAAEPPQATNPQQQSLAVSAQPASAEEQPAVVDQPPETTQPVVAMAAVVQQDAISNKSRDQWYEKLLMTLSGAFVASSVAWLLIGSAPPRRSEPMLTYETERMAR